MLRHFYVTAVLAVLLNGCDASGDLQNKTDSTQEHNRWQPAWAGAETALLRPGSKLFPSECTVGFLFVDPAKGRYYASTAAHCATIEDSPSEDGTGMRVKLEDTGEIGTVVFDGDAYTPKVDFALIELDTNINLMANPQMIEFQGPTGFIACLDIRTGDSLGIYGHGFVFDTADLLLAREGIFIDCREGRYASAIVTDGGDSGAPVLHLDTGNAVGVHLGKTSDAGSTGPTMTAIFAALNSAGLGSVALATIDGSYVGGSAN